ncbi:hypothetical protein ACJX0J_027093, partial [Zea mays]
LQKFLRPSNVNVLVISQSLSQIKPLSPSIFPEASEMVFSIIQKIYLSGPHFNQFSKELQIWTESGAEQLWYNNFFSKIPWENTFFIFGSIKGPLVKSPYQVVFRNYLQTFGYKVYDT